MSNQTEAPIADLSSQEEADTSLILYSAEIHKSGTNVHIYASDTDVFVLALSAMQQLGDKTTLITGTGSNRRHIPLMPIYHALGQNRIYALIGFHALSGCDTTGRIFGKSENIIKGLGDGEQPSYEVLGFCEFI